MPDPDVSAQIISILLERKEVSVKDLTKELGVSYPLVLRVINDLTGLGITTTSKLKMEGRGRPRKLVRINVGKLSELLEECRRDLSEVESLIASLSTSSGPAGEAAASAPTS
ncbi:transcriptional regulator [Acidilobus sp. SCGC AC-742_E15]|nr:transcriptional regulator [Acidilobus sp. SCGC AC-742_E15]